MTHKSLRIRCKGISDYQMIFDNMQKPAFVFYGRNIVGFIVYSIGKLLDLDPWLKDMPAVA
jgi:DNA-binding transcriptional regulator of glucitol operon